MKLAEIAQPDARFFLKSEYGPLSADWPVVAFSNQAFETQIRREYRTGQDFIIYLGTTDEKKTLTIEDRGSLLSVAEIDTTRVFDTYEHIAPASREWAEANYPDRWLRSFRVVRGFDIPSRPSAAQLLPNTDRQMWHVAFREVDASDRRALLDINVDVLNNIDILQRQDRPLEPRDLLEPKYRTLSQEALRLANLVYNRVGVSGQIVQHRAPERSAPTNLHLQIMALLMQDPLLCALCNGSMQVPSSNKLLKISGDRRDSSLGDYGPENYQLVHYACNLAKNNATEEEFSDWLAMVRQAASQERESIND